MGALDCVTSSDKIKATESTEVFTINIAGSNSCLDEPRRDLESEFSKSSTIEKHSIWWTLAIDIPLLLSVAILIGLIELGVIKGHKAGFYCNDQALNHTFTGDTVSAGALISTIFLLPFPVLFITELVFLNSAYLQRSLVDQALRNTIWLYRSYAYGLFLNLSVVEVMKMITGAPRPTFFDICEPDTAKSCKGSEFVYTFECTPSKRFSSWAQSDSYHSFPSGHTSLSIHCGLFLAWYLQRRAFNWSHRSIFVVPVLQLTFLTYSALCSLTRVTDHRHHWWDVLFGSVIGCVSMLYSVLVLCNNFSYGKTREEIVQDQQPNGLLYQNTRPELIS